MEKQVSTKAGGMNIKEYLWMAYPPRCSSSGPSKDTASSGSRSMRQTPLSSVARASSVASRPSSPAAVCPMGSSDKERSPSRPRQQAVGDKSVKVVEQQMEASPGGHWCLNLASCSPWELLRYTTEHATALLAKARALAHLGEGGELRRLARQLAWVHEHLWAETHEAEEEWRHAQAHDEALHGLQFHLDEREQHHMGNLSMLSASYEGKINCLRHDATRQDKERRTCHAAHVAEVEQLWRGRIVEVQAERDALQEKLVALQAVVVRLRDEATPPVHGAVDGVEAQQFATLHARQAAVEGGPGDGAPDHRRRLEATQPEVLEQARYAAFEAHMSAQAKVLSDREDVLAVQQARVEVEAWGRALGQLGTARASAMAELAAACRDLNDEQQALRAARLELQAEARRRWAQVQEQLQEQQQRWLQEVLREREALWAADREEQMGLMARQRAQERAVLERHYAALARAAERGVEEQAALLRVRESELQESINSAREELAAARRREALEAQAVALRAVSGPGDGARWDALQRELAAAWALESAQQRESLASELQARYSALLEDERASSRAALESQGRALARALEAEREVWQRRLSDVVEAGEGRLAEALGRHAEALVDVQRRADADRRRLEQRFEAQRREQEETHGVQLSEVREEAAEREAQLRADHAREIAAAEVRHGALRVQLQEKLQQEFREALSGLRLELQVKDEEQVAAEQRLDDRVQAEVARFACDIEVRYSTFMAQQRRIAAETLAACHRAIQAMQTQSERAAAEQRAVVAQLLERQAEALRDDAARALEARRDDFAAHMDFIHRLLTHERARRTAAESRLAEVELNQRCTQLVAASEGSPPIKPPVMLPPRSRGSNDENADPTPSSATVWGPAIQSIRASPKAPRGWGDDGAGAAPVDVPVNTRGFATPPSPRPWQREMAELQRLWKVLEVPAEERRAFEAQVAQVGPGPSRPSGASSQQKDCLAAEIGRLRAQVPLLELFLAHEAAATGAGTGDVALAELRRGIAAYERRYGRPLEFRGVRLMERLA